MRVVLGLSGIDYGFNNSTRALVLRRGLLAQLRAGTYTVAVDLANGEQRTINLTVEDSTPEGVNIFVAEYDTYVPSREPDFALPLSRLTVRNVTAVKNSSVQTQKEGTDYRVSDKALTLTKTALENFRRSSGYVEFSVTMSDNSVYTLVIDYI